MTKKKKFPRNLGEAMEYAKKHLEGPEKSDDVSKVSRKRETSEPFDGVIDSVSVSSAYEYWTDSSKDWKLYAAEFEDDRTDRGWEKVEGVWEGKKVTSWARGGWAEPVSLETFISPAGTADLPPSYIEINLSQQEFQQFLDIVLHGDCGGYPDALLNKEIVALTYVEASAYFVDDKRDTLYELTDFGHLLLDNYLKYGKLLVEVEDGEST